MSRFAPLVLVLVLAQSACTETSVGSLGESEAESEASSEEVPEVGACRVLAPEDLPEPVNTGDVVDCSEPHTAETFAVGELPASLRDASYGDRRLGEFAYDTCTRAFLKFTGANESLALRSLLSWAWFRPTRDAWEEGARWYRCDVVAGEESSEELLELPETAQGLLLGTGDDRVMQCVRGEAVPGSPRVPCSEPHDWRAVTTIVLGKEDDPYPGDRLVEVRSRDFCDDSVSAWLDYPLQYVFAYTWFHEAEWKAGNRRSICWARYDR
jgi:hypothetical protein